MNRSTIIMKRLESAADQGVLVLTPDDSREVHHKPAGEKIDLAGGDGMKTGLGGAAARLIDLLRPLSDVEKAEAGIAPRR